MLGDSRLNKATSIAAYKQAMAQDSYFEPRHFDKVDSAYEHFKDRLLIAALQIPIKVADVP